jgi:hypothetical protein
MKSKSETPGDFTTTARVIPTSLLAIVIGALSRCQSQRRQSSLKWPARIR